MKDNYSLTHQNIVDVLSQYDINNLESFQLLSGGSENTNYKINTVNKSYVLTVSEQKTIQEADELVQLLDYLRRHHFSSSRVIPTLLGQSTGRWNNKPVMLKDFLEGDIVDELPDHLLVSLGRDIAKLHVIPPPSYLPRKVSYGLERFDEVKRYAPHSSFYRWLKATQHTVESYMSNDLPQTLIHSDIFSDNIIVSPDGNNATIMDFEEATHYYRVFDLGMAIIGTCRVDGKISLAKAKSLLQGYCQKITLKDSEVRSLQAFSVYGAAATAFWRHQNFNDVNIDEAMADHYLPMMNLAIEISEIPLASFQKEIGISLP